MREFKFIRGIYTNENIFNSDETEDCWFACDKNGNNVLFTTQNNEDFQERFARLSSERLSELYTIRPSQFEVYAKNVNDIYEFSYKLKDKVYDGSEDFPENVKEKAKSYLREHTTATISGKPELILTEAEKKTTSVSFAFNDEHTSKVLKRDLYFKVSGDVEEFTITEAEGTNIEVAYTKTNSNVNYNDKLYNKTFHLGRLQKIVTPTQKKIAPKNEYVNESNYNKLNVASQYTAGAGLMFVYNQSLTHTIKYADDVIFDLYREVEKYLVEADATTALTGENTINDGFVAYEDGECPDRCYYMNNESTCNAYTLSDGCLREGEQIRNDKEYYTYYKIMTKTAYVSVGKCEVETRGVDTIVKGYSKSFSSFFIIDASTQQLRPLTDSNLDNTENIISVYENDGYHIIESSAYENDSTNTKYYVTLKSTGTIHITTQNVEVTLSGELAPRQDNTIFRQIVENTLKIEATES